MASQNRFHLREVSQTLQTFTGLVVDIVTGEQEKMTLLLVQLSGRNAPALPRSTFIFPYSSLSASSKTRENKIKTHPTRECRHFRSILDFNGRLCAHMIPLHFRGAKFAPILPRWTLRRSETWRGISGICTGHHAPELLRHLPCRRLEIKAR